MIDGLMAKPRSIWAAISLALDHAPDRLRRLLPSGLRSRHDHDRLIAAAVLALLDSPWSWQQLLNVLERSYSQDATIECRCALRECRDQRMQQAADEWEEKYSNIEEPIPTSDRFMYSYEGGCEHDAQ